MRINSGNTGMWRSIDKYLDMIVPYMAMMPLLYDYVVFVKLKLCCASGCFHADIKFIKDKLGVQCRFYFVSIFIPIPKLNIYSHLSRHSLFVLIFMFHDFNISSWTWLSLNFRKSIFFYIWFNCGLIRCPIRWGNSSRFCLYL